MNKVRRSAILTGCIALTVFSASQCFSSVQTYIFGNGTGRGFDGQPSGEAQSFGGFWTNEASRSDETISYSHRLGGPYRHETRAFASVSVIQVQEGVDSFYTYRGLHARAYAFALIGGATNDPVTDSVAKAHFTDEIFLNHPNGIAPPSSIKAIFNVSATLGMDPPKSVASVTFGAGTQSFSIPATVNPFSSPVEIVLPVSGYRPGVWWTGTFGATLEATAVAAPGTALGDASHSTYFTKILFPDGTTPESNGFVVTMGSGLPSPNLAIPEPTSIALMSSGLLALVPLFRRAFRQSRGRTGEI